MGSRFRHQKGLTALEAIVTLCLISILIGVVIPRYQRAAMEARETALKTGLTNIRTSIKLFKMLNGRNPGSLHELLEKEVMLPARVGADPYTGSVFKSKYLMAQVRDGNGNCIDAFGNPFSYDLERGEVRSTTKGYETW